MTPNHGGRGARVLARCLAVLVLAGAGWPLAAHAAKSGSGPSLLPGANSKDPVNIDAGKLDYFDKEQKLVYTGDVVAVQGDTTLKASVLTIFLQKSAPDQPGGAPAPAPAGPGPGAGSSVKHMEADGPVTMISKDQIGTGDHATYDKAENKIYLIGNVTLSQGTNITQGDRLVYDLTTTRAQVFSGNTTARVKSVFTPGSGTPGTPAAPGGADAAAADVAKKDKTAKRKPAGKKAATAADQPVDQ